MICAANFSFCSGGSFVNEFAREGALSELMYADDLVLMSETIQEIMDKFIKLNEAFESKGLKVNLVKIR